jgi:hypothetical protein
MIKKMSSIEDRGGQKLRTAMTPCLENSSCNCGSSATFSRASDGLKGSYTQNKLTLVIECRFAQFVQNIKLF